jgi:hypothetical protein
MANGAIAAESGHHSPPPLLCHPLPHPCPKPPVQTGDLTPSRSSTPLAPRYTRLLSPPTAIRNHASPTVARSSSSSSSNSPQCPGSLLDSPTPQNCEPVARRGRHTALLARRDPPVDPPHSQILSKQAATGHRWSGTQARSEQAEHSRRQARVTEQSCGAGFRQRRGGGGR